MRKRGSDLITGNAVIAGGAVVVTHVAGIGQVLMPLYLCTTGVLVLNLYESIYSLLAILLLPAILLRRLLPKPLHRAIAVLPEAEDAAAR